MRKLGRSFLAVLLSLVFVVALPISASATVITETVMPPQDGQVMPMYNNVVDITASLIIVGDRAEITASYDGIPNVTTGAVIEITLQKEGLLWWSDVGSTYIHNFNTVSNSCFHSIKLDEYGEYRACVTFTISGTMGPDDEKYEECYATYSASSPTMILLAPMEIGKKFI